MRHRNAFPAERTFRRCVRRDVEAPEGVDGDVQPRRAAGSVDEDGRAGDRSTGQSHGLDRLLYRSARRHDVVDDEHSLARRDREPAAELAAGAAFAPFRVDRAYAQLPRHFVREDDPAGGGAGNRLDGERPGPRRDRGAQPLGVGRVLQDLELLQIERGVFSRRENEVSLAKRTRVAEDPLHVGRCDGHQDYCAAMKIHDVSLVLRPDMITWPSEPAPKIEPLRRIAKGDTANVSVVTISDHAGTHVDPPIHFLEGGNTVDKMPLEALIGPCVVVAFDGPGHISADWLEKAKIPPRTERILFKTRNSARWGDPNAAFSREFTTRNASAAKWCVDHGVKLVGIDYLSIEPQGPEKEGYPVHKTLLGANVVIIEGLDLRGPAPGQYELFCGPLKLLNGDGAPARVFLIER
jgi:arylformamidase